ncbi:MAG: [FeFe] hydrogenase H-cluster radical SAM maturase HydE [Desulfitobacteriaceae bacterium]
MIKRNSEEIITIFKEHFAEENMVEANIISILSSQEAETLENLLTAADLCRRNNIGDRVYFRGLIEFSNHCDCNCFYCGIRKNNQNILRYRLKKDQIINIALAAYQAGFHSVALQSGEVHEPAEVDFVVEVVKAIKEHSQALDANGQGLGITLSMGELSFRQYNKLWEAGAHRYLLRIETSDAGLFNSLHPPTQTYTKRLECLTALKDIGFQVGTGVMIGLPGQNFEHLAHDLKFFVDQDIDMLGMGPYIPHKDTPMYRTGRAIQFDTFSTTLKMLALARLLMPDINMVASTALQTIHPQGLELGLKAGANVVMPILTPETNRQQYRLYENNQYKEVQQLTREIMDSGFTIGLWEWGDSPHYRRRMTKVEISGGD